MPLQRGAECDDVTKRGESNAGKRSYKEDLKMV